MVIVKEPSKVLDDNMFRWNKGGSEVAVTMTNHLRLLMLINEPKTKKEERNKRKGEELKWKLDTSSFISQTHCITCINLFLWGWALNSLYEDHL